MYDKEIINVVNMQRKYEYCIVSRNHKILNYSESLYKYCDGKNVDKNTSDLFDIVPELVGMEESLEDVFNKNIPEFCIPLVFKVPSFYINICVYHGEASDTLLVLFEDITELTSLQQDLGQAHKENLLLLDDVQETNKQLEVFNQEMQMLVEEEVQKNKDQQHMLELQTRHAQMGEMIAMITHQWKQPLSVIKTLGTLLKIKYETSTLTKQIFDEKMDNLLTQVNHMNQTVNDFQDFFIPSKEKVSFEIKEAIESVLHLVQIDYSVQNIDMIIQIKKNVFIEGYINQYKQVILSIIQNAKYALNMSIQKNKKITITIDNVNNKSCVTILDNAGGIPNEIIDEVFTQYVTTKETGSGLGLYIAKKMIEESMQGELWVKNHSHGAMFTVVV